VFACCGALAQLQSKQDTLPQASNSKTSQVSEAHLALYVATVLEVIARTAKVTDDLLRTLLPHILFGTIT